MQPGRKPKPTQLRIVEGNREHRPINENEAKFSPLEPECPDWLSDEAKAEWSRIVKELKTVGMLTLADRSALAGYCQAWARWSEAERVIDEKGTVFETDSGYCQQRPEVVIAHKYLDKVIKFCAEFGLTPSSRGRIRLPDVEENDEDLD
jgi:P27 family predicted phage terminase small subunit